MALEVEIAGDELRLAGTVTCRTAADYLFRYDQWERARLVERALEIGVFCLERTSTSQDVEFVRRQVDGLLSRVAAVLEGVPAKVEAGLLARIGTGNGQVLAPVVNVVTSSVKAAESGIAETRKLLADADPTRTDGTIGRAFQQVNNMLDPQRRDSVPARIEEVLKGLGESGGTFATCVKDAVDQAIKPLKDHLVELSRRVIEQEAAAEVVNRTTEKGRPYEESVFERVRQWAARVGATAEHCGPDNQPGDVIVRFGATSVIGRTLSLVVEARDRGEQKGLKRLKDDVQAAMTYRASTVAVYVGANADAFGKEVGDWIDGRADAGPFVACVDGLLEQALRYAVALVHLDDLHTANRELDVAAVAPYLAHIRTALRRVPTIKCKVTTVRDAMGAIESELDMLKTDVAGALDTVEGMLKRAAVVKAGVVASEELVGALAS